MKIRISLFMFLIISISSGSVMAEGDWIRVDGPIDQNFTKVTFLNPDKVNPVVFESGHHEINKCFKILNGFLIFVTSGEGLFEGYELIKEKPTELKEKKIPYVHEIIQNEAGIHLGLSKQRIENIFKRKLNDYETKISYESVTIINDIPFDVTTSVVITFENEKLAKLSVITSTTN